MTADQRETYEFDVLTPVDPLLCSFCRAPATTVERVHVSGDELGRLWVRCAEHTEGRQAKP